jgi:hypothetical protein
MRVDYEINITFIIIELICIFLGCYNLIYMFII